MTNRTPTSPPFLEQQLVQHWPPESWSDVTVVVAVSGGPDSVALLRALRSVALAGAGRLVVAHFNHRLRGEESEADERFVRQISRDWDLACEVARTERSGDQPSPGSEDAFRDARYGFLCQVAARRGARYVATAHTADDQAETVLHRVIRGTGIAGLAGIRRFRPLLHGVALVRPLLSVRRRHVLEYLQSCGQPYREDSSNRSSDFTRNRIRLDLIPRIEGQFNAHLVPALTRLASLADEVQGLIDERVAALLPCVQRDGGDRVTIDCRPLIGTRPLLVRELLVAVWKRQGWPRQAMSYARWEQLGELAATALAGQQRQQHIFPGGIVAERSGDRLTLQR